MWVVDDERHPDNLVIGVVPLLMQPAVRAEEFTMVGQIDHDGVAIFAPRGSKGAAFRRLSPERMRPVLR